MAVAPPSRETPLTSAWLLPPPPPNFPRTPTAIGFADDDEERNWLEELMDWGEVDIGCDFSEGALAPNGCRW